MRSLIAYGLLLILGSGCRSQVADREDEKAHQRVEALPDSIKTRDAEIARKGLRIASLESELADRKADTERLTLRLERLSSENAAQVDRNKALNFELDSSHTLVAKLEADMQVFVRQLEVQLAQINELANKVDEQRAKLINNLTLGARVQDAMQRVAQLERQLADLKGK